jgi:predicted transcriptional regulator
MDRKFNINNLGSKEDFIEYATEFLLDYLYDSVVVTTYGNALEIVKDIEHDFMVSDSVRYTIEDSDIVILRSVDEIFLISEFKDKEGFEKYLTSDYILVEDILDDETIDEYLEANEEIEIVTYFKKNCTCCENCHCHDDEERIKLPYDLLDEAQKEYIDEIVSETEYSADVLAEVFNKAFDDGIRTASLSISKAINEAIENE